jgi:hypothetical protein
LATLIPPPRLHRHRYPGVLAPNSPLRRADAATAYGRDADFRGEQPPPQRASHPSASPPGLRASAHYLWAMLLARLFVALPLVVSFRQGCMNFDHWPGNVGAPRTWLPAGNLVWSGGFVSGLHEAQ